ncbi:ATP-binding protein [Paraflavisolibacter sp. H34]|uniref:AAA family ATPase n=1 Tax=Huijunlia imazamoxiresistens TaxID=3127457 RepID=UPI0030188A44
MLINFSVKNYLSFKEEVNLSMVASSLKEVYDFPQRAEEKLTNDLSVLPVAAIYGANASGKSNLLTAIGLMRYFVLHSFAPSNVEGELPAEPFAFSAETEKEPSEFEATFTNRDIIYRYGFEITNERVVSEWLYQKELKLRSKEREVFFREEDELSFHPALFKVGKVIRDQKLAKKNVLVSTLAFQLNDEVANNIVSWFAMLNLLQGHLDEEFEEISREEILKHSNIAQKMEDLVRFADTSIEKLNYRSVDGDPKITTVHMFYNEKGEPVGQKELLLNGQESAGTKKLFNLSGPIFSSLEFGEVLIIDEMDSKLHPNLMERLVLMFQDLKLNQNGAQLIFTTHNTNILNARLLRRDQVWLTEKDSLGATRLYSIADYKTNKGKARNTEALEQNYIEGKYGGVPFLGNLDNFLEQQIHEQKGPAQE